MSDGDNATPGQPRASGTDNESITRTPSRAPGAAPWERAMASSRLAASRGQWSARPSTDAGESTGSHSGGALTVADLIAKVGATTQERPSHHRAAPEPHPHQRAEKNRNDTAQAAAALSRHSAPTVDTVGRPPAERRPLGAKPAAATTVLPPARVAPARVGQLPAGADQAPKRTTGHRPVLLAGRLVAALMAVLALALTGGAWQWSTSKNNSLNKISALDPHSRDIVDPSGQYGDENFLIVGVDSRAGENSAMGAGDTEDAGGARSDTVMLVNIPADRKRVVAVSFPRDLAITPMRCEAWNPDTGAYGPLYDEQTGTYGSDMIYTETKLNSAFAFGGPKCLVKVIQKLSGLSINRFMAIDFAGFSRMVDALGGVEVCSTTRLYDYELGTVLAHSGRQVVDGETALNYVRARNVSTENNGDYGRIKRQQLFLSSLLRSLISKDTFFSLSKLNNVVNMFIGDSYVDNVTTKDLVDLGQSVQGVTAGHITFVTVPTGETDEDGNEPPRTRDMRALFDAIINDDPLPGETDQNSRASGSTSTTQSTTSTAKPTSPLASSYSEQMDTVTTPPQGITVQVSNATGRTGLAATATDKLEQQGFNVMTPDDYPSSLKSTTVFFSPGNEQAAATVASTFARSEIERVSGMGRVVQVVLGPDFHAVSTPPPSGSSVSVQINRNTGSTPTRLPDDLTVTNAADTTCE